MQLCQHFTNYIYPLYPFISIFVNLAFAMADFVAVSSVRQCDRAKYSISCSPKASKKLTDQENGHYAFFNPNSTIVMGARKLKLIKQHSNQLSWNYNCNKTELDESVTFYANYCLISPNLPHIYRKSTVCIIIF